MKKDENRLGILNIKFSLIKSLEVIFLKNLHKSLINIMFKNIRLNI
jgi:hypothetical protein